MLEGTEEQKLGPLESICFWKIILLTLLILVPLLVIFVVVVVLLIPYLCPYRNLETCETLYQVEITPSTSELGNFERWAVATDAAPCTSVTRNVFRNGGTTADAAVATLLCMGVVNPHTSGIGGGFLATLYKSSTKEAYTVNARETAPAAATFDMFTSNPNASSIGGLSVGIPGELRGYEEILRVMGTNTTWENLFNAAVKLARNGFAVGKHLAGHLQSSKDVIYETPNLRKVFWNFESNDIIREGEILVQRDLGDTLEAIGKKGADYYYKGTFAEKMALEIQTNGGIITSEDLRSYKAVTGAAVNASFKDGRVLYSVPPPGSGAIVAYILGIMDAYRSSGADTVRDDVLTLHRFTEACKFAYAKRSHLDDKASVEINQLLKNLTSSEYAAATRSMIDDRRTFDDLKHYDKFVTPYVSDHGTAHASFWGPDGDIIAVTTTVNYYFGSKVRTSGGVILNNEMDDFSTPGLVNLWDLAPSKTNFIAPGKRPISSMAPFVIVNDKGDADLVLGGAGGSKITSGMALVAMRNLWQRDNIKEAIDFPRIHHQLFPNEVEAESHFPQYYAEELKKKGHKVVIHAPGSFSVIQGIKRANGRIYANADFRKGGAVDGE